jgi:hypothetical protein
MSDLLKSFQKRQKDNLTDEIQLHRWSIIILLFMISQEEQRLQDSDVAVEMDDGAEFWQHLQ